MRTIIQTISSPSTIMLFLLLLFTGCVSKQKFVELMDSKEAADKALAETQTKTANLEKENSDLKAQLEAEKTRLQGQIANLEKDLNSSKSQISLIQSISTNYEEWILAAIKKLEPLPDGYGRTELKEDLFIKTGFVKDWKNQVGKALDDQGYLNPSFYLVNGGFAIVSPIEQFDNELKSKKGEERWNVNLNFVDWHNYLKALFYARKGRFRQFIFIITDKHFIPGDTKANFQSAINLFKGPNTLNDSDNDSFLNRKLTEYHQCTALVYVFEKSDSYPNGRIVDDITVDAKQHIIKSNLWESLRKK